MTDNDAAPKPRRKAKQHNISLQESESLALRFLAETLGRHGNKSAVVGGLISARMQENYGDKWPLLVKDHFDNKGSDSVNK